MSGSLVLTSFFLAEDGCISLLVGEWAVLSDTSLLYFLLTVPLLKDYLRLGFLTWSEEGTNSVGFTWVFFSSLAEFYVVTGVILFLVITTFGS